MDSKPSIEYRIELYWPGGKRRFEENYCLYVHDDKVDRVNAIPTGSKILFYETEKDDEGNLGGSKTVFAAGTLTDEVPSKPDSFEDAYGKVWRQSRLVTLEAWVPPANGVSLNDLRNVLHKSGNWKMRSGPHPIKSHQFETLLKRLKKRRGLRIGHAKPWEPTASTRKFRSVTQKDEEESIRDQSAERVTIRKIHNQLMNEFSRFCQKTLHLRPKEGQFDALVQFPSTNGALLIEAKSAFAGTQGRHQIRQAIGQLFDYRFAHWGSRNRHIHLAALFPEKPIKGVLDLLESLRIGVIWRYGDKFAATRLVRLAHSVLEKFTKA